MGSALLEICRKLLDAYGEQGWWPVGGTYSPSFKKRKRTPEEKHEICVGAVLAQNTAWANVEKALGKLREAGALDREKMEKLGEKELAALIRPAGYYNLKAKKLKAFLKYGGRMEREALLGIWGLGPETVDSILLYAYGKPIFVVDAYTKRIAGRMGLAKEKKGGGNSEKEYAELQMIFREGLPEDAELFNEFHALLVKHAKEHCRVNPLCKGCPLEKGCGKRGIG